MENILTIIFILCVSIVVNLFWQTIKDYIEIKEASRQIDRTIYMIDVLSQNYTTEKLESLEKELIQAQEYNKASAIAEILEERYGR